MSNPDTTLTRDAVEARNIVAQLARDDAAVRCFPEPRLGDAFEKAQRKLSNTYAMAVALGAKIDAEDR